MTSDLTAQFQIHAPSALELLHSASVVQAARGEDECNREWCKTRKALYLVEGGLE
jgi:hypothetical protein